MEISDLWRQVDVMSPSSCPTCVSCVSISQDYDHLCMYEFLMRLHPEFKLVRVQLMHRTALLSLRDTLASVIAEEARLHSWMACATPPSSLPPHSILAATQHDYSTSQLPPPKYDLPQQPSPLGYCAPAPACPPPLLPPSSPSHSAPQSSGPPQRRVPRCHYCHNFGRIRAEFHKLQRVMGQHGAQQRATTIFPPISGASLAPPSIPD